MRKYSVLLVEDDDILQNVVQEVLTHLGHDVLVAKRGEEALRILGSAVGLIGLAIVDLGLPDIRGDKLCPLLKEICPGLKVIIATGYFLQGPEQEHLIQNADGFLPKPFWLGDLAEKIEEVLK